MQLLIVVVTYRLVLAQSDVLHTFLCSWVSLSKYAEVDVQSARVECRGFLSITLERKRRHKSVSDMTILALIKVLYERGSHPWSV